MRYARLQLAGGIISIGTTHYPVHIPGNSHGDDKRRRGQEICIHGFMHAALEIAVARQYGSEAKFAVLLGTVDTFRNAFQQRTAIADAGGASVADKVEAEL